MGQPTFRVSATPLLAEVREARKFSQRELAAAAGGLTGERLPEPTYNKIEANERTCSLLIGQAVAKILGRPTSDLFDLIDA